MSLCFLLTLPHSSSSHASGTAGKRTRPNICFLYLGHWDVCGFGWERSLIYVLSKMLSAVVSFFSPLRLDLAH